MRLLGFTFSSFLLVAIGAQSAFTNEPTRELIVHLAQANNDSPYSFVCAKFEPGEVSDPWAVRFFDRAGAEAPYFVWDSVTWRVAREGRDDWGGRYATLNHHPGAAPEALAMRPRRIEAARRLLPELGAALSASDEGAKQAGDSVCAALYLVRHRVAPLSKDKLTLRTYPTRQIEPRRETIDGSRAESRLAASAGELVLDGLPNRVAVRWRGKELFRYAGFSLGDKSLGKGGVIAGAAHADPARPFSLEIEDGLITKVTLRGQSIGRAEAPASWQCTYWLFPEGGYVGLKGFSFDEAAGYLGGGLSMAILETPITPKPLHEPEWENPWWLHELKSAAYAAIHQFADAPLTVGYGNNPFTASAPASFSVRAGEKTKGAGDGALELNWTYELTDKRLYRLFHPRLDNNGSYDLAEITDLSETLRTGKLTNVPTELIGKDGVRVWPEERVIALEEATTFITWRPREDYLYRQYAVGVGETAADAEAAIRRIVGAACGWIDRPFEEEEIAELLVQFSLRKSSQRGAVAQSAWIDLPDALNEADRPRAAEILRTYPGPVEIAADAMERIRKHVAAGGSPIQGQNKEGGEGWHNNPAYAAVDAPVALSFIDHFQLYDLTGRRAEEHRQALLEWAEFSLETLGGKPLDWNEFRANVRSLWPNRVVMLVPLMLWAHRETGDEKYAWAARLVFEDLLMTQVERNPHGYFWAWGHAPRKAEPFDLNYNVAAHDRGIIDFWLNEQLEIIGRERAAKFVAAQARYLAFSGQLLDTLETDNMTAIGGNYPGQVPFAIGQAALLLADDFLFYRGLVGDLVRWGVIDDGARLEDRLGRRNLYGLKIGARGAVFWAYGIGSERPSRSKTAREMRARWLDAGR